MITPIWQDYHVPVFNPIILYHGGSTITHVVYTFHISECKNRNMKLKTYNIYSKVFSYKIISLKLHFKNFTLAVIWIEPISIHNFTLPSLSGFLKSRQKKMLVQSPMTQLKRIHDKAIRQYEPQTNKQNTRNGE